jgi:hypothetical protein
MEAKVTISKKRRNTIFHHLGLPIPYNLGKKCAEFTIVLGKTTGEGIYTAGNTIGSAISVIRIKVIDKSDEQISKNTNGSEKGTIPGKSEGSGKV